MHRRQVLASTGLLVAGITGCSGADPGGGTETATPSGTTPDRQTRTRTRTRTPTGFEHAAEQPDPDLAVGLVNRDDDPHSLSLTVTRTDGDVVHESVHDLEPGAQTEAYNLQSADPDGVERFTIAVEVGDRREAVNVQTSECYGDVRFSVDDGGELDVTYAIC